MSDSGKAVLDSKRALHVASAAPHVTLCGVEWVALDLHWATTTRMICTRCADVVMGAPAASASPAETR